METTPKIIIDLYEGNINAIYTTLPQCEILVIDTDDDADKSPWVSDVQPQAARFAAGEAHLLYACGDANDNTIAEKLSQLNF